MLTLTDYIVLDRLYSGGTGPEAQTGDEVRLYLDTEAVPAFPEYIIGVIQNPIVRVNCETSTSYSIEYDEADLLGAVEFLRPQDVINSEVTSALDELANAIEVETAARIADVNAEEAARIAALSNEAYDAGTWDGVTTVAPSKNVVRDKFEAMDAAKQPLDSDLTAFASGASAAALGDATAQANRRSMTNSAKKASTVSGRTPSYRHAQSGEIDLSSVQVAGNFISGDELEIDGVPLAFGAEITIGGSFAASVANLIEAIQSDTICTAYYNATNYLLVLMAQSSGISANGAIWTADLDAYEITQTGELGGGSATYTTTTPTEIGESIFTTHSDGTVTEWSAPNTSPAAWIPRTAGIILHANGDWYRQTLAADGTAEYELLPNQ